MKPKTSTENPERPTALPPARGSATKTFVIPGTLYHKQTRYSRRKPQSVSIFLEAEDREDALWQAHHGVIEMDMAKSFPDATVKYDLRQMICQSQNNELTGSSGPVIGSPDRRRSE